MSADTAAAILLIAVPIGFNAAFFELGRTFDYPNTLRKEPDEILRRFAAGGSSLLWRWQALLVTALATLPLVALLAVVSSRDATSPPRGLTPRPPGARPSWSSRPSIACSGWASANTWDTC